MCNKRFSSLPSFGKVGPVSHDYCAQHHVILGEVTVEQISGTHHGHAKNIGHLHTHTHTHVQAGGTDTFYLFTKQQHHVEILLKLIQFEMLQSSQICTELHSKNAFIQFIDLAKAYPTWK